MYRCAWLFSVMLAALRTGDIADFARTETPVTLEKQSKHTRVQTPRSNREQVLCGSDRDCPNRSFCPTHDFRHDNSLGPSHSRCESCKRRGRRCHRDQMCCLGNQCRNYVCHPVVHRHSVLYSRLPYARTVKKQKTRTPTRTPDVKGVCVRSSDCRPGECCARWLWVRVCKPRPKAGEVCVSDARRKETLRLDLYQRCPCDTGLTCTARTHTHTGSNTHTHSPLHTQTRPHSRAHRLHTCQVAKFS